MEFWITYFSFLSILFIVGVYVKNKKMLVYLLLSIIWIIGAFRYMIGIDYYSYQQMYYSVTDDSILSLEKEPIIFLCMFIFNQIGLEAQSFFLFAETFILFFIYQGLLRYSNNDYNKVFISLSLYVLMYVPGTYFWSFNGIRQCMAAALIFWGAHYYYDNKYMKFASVSLIAVLIHFSALMGVLGLILWEKLNLSKKQAFIILCISIILAALNIPGKSFGFVISHLGYYGDKYASVANLISLNVRVSFGFATTLSIITGLCMWNFFDKRRYIKISFLYIIVVVLTSFQLADDNSVMATALSSTIHRFEVYYVLFFIMLLSDMIISIKNKQLAFFAVIFSISFLFTIQTMRGIERQGSNVLAVISDNPSFGNIDYQFNFKLIR